MQGGEKVKKSIKIRLLPTEEQEVLMLKSSGCSRFAYNWALNKCNEKYNNNEKIKFIKSQSKKSLSLSKNKINGIGKKKIPKEEVLIVLKSF